MNLSKYISIITLIYINNLFAVSDLTIIGQVYFADGFNRLPIVFTDILKEDLSINYIHDFYDSKEVSNDIRKIIEKKDKNPGNVGLTFFSWYSPKNTEYKVIDTKIKLAYSMFECSSIPKEWVNLFNEKFDAVIVPDPWVEKMYSDSGVNIPIFTLPIAMYMEDLLAQNKKATKNKIFTFGFSGYFIGRKNFELIIDSFAKEFGNDKNFQLKIHGRGGYDDYFERLKESAKKHGLSNVEIVKKSLNNFEYIKFLSSLDCFVTFSKGEGFCVPPREALALGIPCVIANNTGMKTICQTGFVKSVESNIHEYLGWPNFDNFVSAMINTKIEDATKALRDVYENYNFYLEQAQKGREWVKQYLPENLKLKHINLIKPKKIILGEKNIVENEYLMTNSKELYSKYLKILST